MSPTPEERRAYDDGVRDQEIRNHSAHLKEINGQIKTLAANTGENGLKLDQILVEMPRVLSVAEEAEKAKTVADALERERARTRTTWDRYKNWLVATVGIMVSLAALTTFVRGFNPPAAPPAQTVTAPDITPR